MGQDMGVTLSAVRILPSVAGSWAVPRGFTSDVSSALEGDDSQAAATHLPHPFQQLGAPGFKELWRMPSQQPFRRTRRAVRYFSAKLQSGGDEIRRTRR